MQSMDEIYKQYARTVYKFLLSLSQNEDLAEELTQETFYQAVRCIERYDGSCTVSTWLCAIAKNQLAAYRRKHPPAERSEDSYAVSPSAEDSALSSETRIELLKGLHTCPEPYREVIYLRIFGNLSFREIGEIMGWTENRARVTFYRGKERLRKEFSQDDGESTL